MKKVLSILLCVLLLLSLGAVTALAAEEEAKTREIYVAVPSSWHSEESPLTLYVGTDSYIWPDNSSTYSEKILLEVTGEGAILAKATIPSTMTSAYLDGGSGSAFFPLTPTHNVYAYCTNMVGLTAASMDGITVMEFFKDAITVPEGTTAILVGVGDWGYGVPYRSVNNGTILYAYTKNAFINNGTILDGEFAYLENYGTIEDGIFTYNIHNYGTVHDGYFVYEDNVYGKTVLYNYAGGTVSASVREAAQVVEAQNVTLNLTNLTHNAQSLTTTPGEYFVFDITAAEGYAVPESITVTIGGQTVESGYNYFPAVDSRSAEIRIWDSAQTGPIVITAAGEEATFAQVADLTVGDVHVVKNSVLRTASGKGWSYDPTTNTLTLSDIRIGADNGHVDGNDLQGIHCYGDLNMMLQGTNSIDFSTHTGYNVTVCVEGDLSIRGSGLAHSLTLTGGNALGSQHYGLEVYDNLVVDNCTLNVTSGEAVHSYAISCENMTVTGDACVTATAGNAEGYSTGVSSGGTIFVESGSLTGVSGISSNSTDVGIRMNRLIQTGGTVTGTGSSSLYSSRGVSVGEATVTGGTLIGNGGTAAEGGESVGIYVDTLTVGPQGTVTATAGSSTVSRDVCLYGWNDSQNQDSILPVSITNNGIINLKTDTMEEAMDNSWSGLGFGFVETDKIIFNGKDYVPGGDYQKNYTQVLQDTYFTFEEGYIFVDANGGMGFAADITLTEGLVIPEGADFAVAPGATVTVPEGKSLDLSKANRVDVDGDIVGDVVKVTPMVTPPIAYEDLEYYRGREMDLVEPGSTTAGTLQYSMDGEVWSEEIPTAVNAGTYTVYYRVAGNNFVNDVAAASVTVTVNPYEVSANSLEIQGLAESYEYLGEPLTPAVTLYRWEAEFPAEEYVVTFENNDAVGTATVKITDAEGGNFAVPELTATFQIVHTQCVFTDKASDELVTPATCTEPAIYKVKCDGCDAVSEDKTIPVGEANGHAWGKWAQIKAPEVGVKGEERRDCGNCDAFETRDVDPLPEQKPTDPTEPSKPEDPTTPSKPEDPTTPSEPEKKENPFVDIKEDMFCYDAVLWAYEKEITTGKDDTHFAPSQECTRAQVVTFLWRAAGKPVPKSAKNPFPDVPADKYYTDAVLWAVEQGITAGFKDGTFGPNKTCTRGQIVTFLWRYAGEPAPRSNDNPFPDLDVTSYCGDAVLWAVENGITTGYKDGTFGPNKICKRDQIVTFLYRAMVQ